MRQRQVGGVVRDDRERDADQLRVHHVEAGSLGIHADQFGGEQFFQPGVELGVGEDGFVVRAVGAGGLVAE